MANYNLGNLFWKIDGDTRNFDKSVSTTDKKVNSFGGTLKKIGSTIGIAFAAKKVFDFSKRIVGLASDLNESQNAINVVFGNAAQKLDEFGRTASTSVGLTQNAFNSLATGLGAQLKQSGLAIDEVADSTIDLTKRAADTASIFNVEVSDALGAFNAALRGEAEPARRFGINISDAAVQAEALASGLVKDKKEITDQIKVQARLNLIMQQSSDYAGDFQNTSSGLANQQRIMKARFEENATVLGQALLPIVNVGVSLFNDMTASSGDLSQSIKDFVTSAEGAATVADILGSVAGTFAVIAESGSVIFDALSESVDSIITPFKDLSVNVEGTGLAFTIVGGVVQAFSAGLRIAGVVIGGAIDNIINLGRAVLAVGDVVGTFTGLLTGKTTFGELKESIGDAKDAIVNFGSSVVDNYAVVADQIKNEIVGFSDGAEENAKRFQEAFDNAASEVGQRVFDAMRAASSDAEDIIAEGNDAIEEDTKDTATSIEKFLSSMGDTVKDRITAATDVIGSTFNSVVNSISKLSDAVTEKQIANIDSVLNKQLSAYDEQFEAQNKLLEDTTNAQVKALDEQTQALLVSLGIQEQTTLEKLESELLDLQEKLAEQKTEKDIAAIEDEIRDKQNQIQRTRILEDAETRKTDILDEADKQRTELAKQEEEARAKATEDSERKKAKIKYEADKAEWEASKLIAIANASVAAITTFAQLGFTPWGFAAVAAGAVATGIELAAIDKARPQMPSFQDGGIVPGTPSRTDNTLAMVASGEEILTMDDPRHRNNMGRNGLGGQMTFIFELDGRQISENTAKWIDSGKVRVKVLSK